MNERQKKQQRRSGESGQSLVLVAGGIVGFAILLAVVINLGIIWQARASLRLAVENATVAALRPTEAGTLNVDVSAGEALARTVLEVELGNITYLDGAPADYAAAATVQIVSPDGVGCVMVGGVCRPGLNSHVMASIDVSLPLYWSSVTLTEELWSSLAEDPLRGSSIGVPPVATPIPTATPIVIVGPTQTPGP